MVNLSHEPCVPWTFADLEALPETPWRFEIVDGSLMMTPGPGRRHEVVSENLRIALREVLGRSWRVIGPQNLDLDPSYLIPDLIVISAELARHDAVLTVPADVELVVEIVSPGSRTSDRITKPVQYAAAGIPAYWRVEIEGTISLTAYALGAGDTLYTELGTWSEGQTAVVTQPFSVELPINHLKP